MKTNPHPELAGAAHDCEHSCCTRLIDVGVQRGGQVLLEKVNLHVHCGETTALLGPNGAGKSTLMKAIIGELPYTGEIRFTYACSDKPVRPVIGYVPQTPRFDSRYPATVRDLFVSCTSRWPVWLRTPKQLEKEILTCLDEVGMADHIDRRVGVLSGGELQRVLLALALRPQPQLLLLDEPSTGVDSRGLEMFYQTVQRVKEHSDLSVLLISHDKDFVLRYADRAVLLSRTVLLSDTPQAVLNSREYRKVLV